MKKRKGKKRDRKEREDHLFAECFWMCVFCSRLIGKGVSMPTGAENRRLNLEKHPPPRRSVGCMDCVAQWLHMEQASRRYFWTISLPSNEAGGITWPVPCPNCGGLQIFGSLQIFPSGRSWQHWAELGTSRGKGRSFPLYTDLAFPWEGWAG